MILAISLGQAIAERIAVNARDAGIGLTAETIASAAPSPANVDARLVYLRMTSSHPRDALAGFQAVLAPMAGLDPSPLPAAASSEQIYERERAIVSSYRVVPLVWLPRVYGLGPRVRDWKAPAAGEGWPFADVWLETGITVTFRSKLFWVFTLALLLSVGVIAAGVTIVARQAFDELNRQHSEALVAQFEGEFERRGQDVVHRVQGIADAEGTVRMAIDLSRPKADVSVYVNDARGVSQSHQLDFLDFVATDGSIISSNEWPARFGYKMDWLTQPQDWSSLGSFLMKVDTQDGPALGLMAVSTVRVGDRDLFIVGGERLGKDFLNSLVLPAGMRALLYLDLDPDFQPTNLVDASGPVVDGERLASFIARERQDPPEASVRDFLDARSVELGSISRAAAARPAERTARRAAHREFAAGGGEARTSHSRPRARGGGHGLVLWTPAELVGSGARDAAGAQTGRRGARSVGRELGRARGRSRAPRNRPARDARSIA